MYTPGGKGPGGLGGVATKRPPIHINNNLGTSTWTGTGSAGGGTGVGSIGTGEKNILKGNSGAKNCRNCQRKMGVHMYGCKSKSLCSCTFRFPTHYAENAALKNRTKT